VAIRTDGSLWEWGRVVIQENGMTEDRLMPMKIMENVASVSAGLNATMAVKPDGSLWAWGINNAGQLGDGTAENRYNPVKIMDDVTAVSIGSGGAWGVDRMHTVAIKTDGSLWGWGSNMYGQLGDGTTENRYYPVRIAR